MRRVVRLCGIGLGAGVVGGTAWNLLQPQPWSRPVKDARATLETPAWPAKFPLQPEHFSRCFDTLQLLHLHNQPTLELPTTYLFREPSPPAA